MPTFSIAGAGLALSSVSSVIGGVGAMQSANAQANAATYNAEIAANNQKIATENSGLAAQAGEAQAEQAALKTRATVGGIKAAQAASNISVDSGSALDVRSSAQELGELNALTVRSNAAKQAYGYQVQAANAGAQQTLDQMEASNASAAGPINAFGTVLGGIGGAAGTYANFLKQGGGSNLLSPGGFGVAGPQVYSSPIGPVE